MIRRLVVALAVLLCAVPARAATIQFLDAGTAETQDLSLWSSTNGTVASSTAVTRNNGRSIAVTSNGAANATSVEADAGRRNTVWFNMTVLPTTRAGIAVVDNTLANTIYLCGINSSGQLELVVGAMTFAATAVQTVNTWYRLSCRHVITNTSTYTVTAAIYDASGTQLDTITKTNSPSIVTGAQALQLFGSNGAAAVTYFSDVYVDDGTDLADPGNISVTFKQPNANSTNNFDTSIGANPANRWTNVNQLPLSVLLAWEQAGSSQVSEVYGLQGASDTTNSSQDVSAKTLVGWGGWAWTKGQAIGTAATNAATSSCNGKVSGTTCVSTLGGTAGGVGDLCVAMFADQVAGAAPTISDSTGGSNTWTALAGPTTSTIRQSGWFSVLSAATTTVTFTFASSANARAGGVACFTAGAVAASPLDKNPANTTDGTSPFNGTATGTLTQANEWVVGLFGIAGNTADALACAAPTATSAITLASTTGGGASSNASVIICYEVVSATTTQTIAATAGSSRAGVQMTASFKRTGATAGTPQLVVNGVDNAVTLSTSAAGVVTAYTTSASYPSGTFGMKSTGTDADTFFYEGGVLVAYTPPVVAGTQAPTLTLLGAGPGGE